MLTSQRHAAFAVLGLVIVWAIYFGGYSTSLTSAASNTLLESTSPSLPSSAPGLAVPAHVQTYFDQIFSAQAAAEYDFPGLTAACARTEWKDENKDVYLKCGGILAGMTSIISQVKVCFKMAVDAGVHMVLPAMPLRDSDDLRNFNLLNDSAYMDYDSWFDQQHLVSAMARACPQMRLRSPGEEDTPAMPVAHRWEVDIGSAPGFRMLSGYFWVGRPFRAWFEEELRRQRFLDDTAAPGEPDTTDGGGADGDAGATIISIASQFLIFRITDDATGRDLALWNDLSALVRFKEAPRAIATEMLSLIRRPYIGVHFRTERDNIWSSFENQLQVDLDALDQVWARYGAPGLERPLVVLACGDESQIQRFAEAAAARGWKATSKYDIAREDPETLRQLRGLPFDFQGAVDMAIMLRSYFFLGITGSALSSTVANMRDSTGRYRGSSLFYTDDGDARTHLFNDGDATAYPCCL